MDVRNALIDFIGSFLMAFVVITGVTYLWNLIFHGAGAADWETSLALAIILGIALAWSRARERQKRGKGN